VRAFAVDEFGGPGSVHELPVPEPEDGYVRVRVAAAGINPADIGVLNGYYKDQMEHRFPLIPGLDFAGTIDAVGAGVEQWKVGDEVFGGVGKMFWGNGSLAEYTTASSSSIARRPEAVDAEFGAALTLPGVSALLCLDPMAIKQDDVVVVIGAAGGIGGFSVQLASAAGAHVIAVTRGVNASYVGDFGAAGTIDYEKEDVFEAVRKAYPEGIAGLVHTAGDNDSLARLAELVRTGGHVASMLGGADVEGLAKRGITGVNIMAMTTGPALEQLAGLFTAGTIKRPEIRTFQLDRAGDAYREIEAGHVRGKLVVIPGGTE
jgi:NADPH2:quinone reductase